MYVNVCMWLYSGRNAVVVHPGYGSLGLSVEGGHRSDLEMKSKSATEYTLQYKPHEPGVYLLNIKFAEEHIAGASVT